MRLASIEMMHTQKSNNQFNSHSVYSLPCKPASRMFSFKKNSRNQAILCIASHVHFLLQTPQFGNSYLDYLTDGRTFIDWQAAFSSNSSVQHTTPPTFSFWKKEMIMRCPLQSLILNTTFNVWSEETEGVQCEQFFIKKRWQKVARTVPLDNALSSLQTQVS